MKSFLLQAVSVVVLQFCPLEALAQVQFLNNSPDSLLAKITVEHRGKMLVQALEYRHATPFIDAVIGNFDTLIIISDAQPNIRRILPIVADNSLPLRIIIQGVAEPSAFAANPEGRDIALSIYYQNTNIESEVANEAEIIFQLGSTDAPICSLNATGVAPLIRKGSFGDAAPFPIPMPAMQYELALVDESGIPSVHRVFKVDIRNWGGKTGICVLSGFWNTEANNGGEPLALLLVNSDGEVKECQADMPSAYHESNQDAENITPSFNIVSEQAVWNVPQIISTKLYSDLGAIIAQSEGNSISTVNLPNGAYFCIGTSLSGDVFSGRILICR